MARDIDNSFVEGNSQATGTRTNVFAEDSNAVQLQGIDKLVNGTYSATFTAAYVAASDEITFTPVTGNDAGTKFYRWVMTDAMGAEVTGDLDIANLGVAVVVSTTSLNKVEGKPTIYFAAKNAAGEEVKYKKDLETGALRADFSL
tara:strand:+ start:700 stop:1134 length:435 start_codon:yes stop_codon:yes gene_type:complete